jgi:hypothetical protein
MAAVRDLETRLGRFFEGRPEISMAFLFGSSARGRTTRQSDTDIGVWLKDGFTQTEVERLWRDVEGVCETNVDLVVLNDARPEIAWAAMRGRRLKIESGEFFLQKMLEISDEAEFMQDFALELYALRRRWRGEAT